MSGPADSQAMARHAGPSVRLSTVSAVVGVLVVVGGFVAFLLTTGARGGEAAHELKVTKAAVEALAAKQEQADARAALAMAAAWKTDSTVAVHDDQIKELRVRLQSIDDSLKQILGRLPPPGGK